MEKLKIPAKHEKKEMTLDPIKVERREVTVEPMVAEKKTMDMPPMTAQEYAKSLMGNKKEEVAMAPSQAPIASPPLPKVHPETYAKFSQWMANMMGGK